MVKSTKKNLTLILTMLMGPISLSLLVLSVYLIQPRVEAKLTTHVQSILKRHDIPARVLFSGRDGVLQGEVETQAMAKHAEKLSLEVFGTRVIRNELSVKGATDTSLDENLSTDEPLVKKISLPMMVGEEQSKYIHHVSISEANKPNISSEVDKIMASMAQQQEVSVPIALSKEKLLPEETADTQALEDKPVAEAKPAEVVVALDVPMPSSNHEEIKQPEKYLIASKPMELLSTEVIRREPKKQENNELLDIIDAFNTSLVGKPSRFASSEEMGFSDGKANKEVPTILKKGVLDEIRLTSVQFETGSSDLPNDSYKELDRIERKFKSYNDANIEIISYAPDSDIAYAYGVAIRNYLSKKGIEMGKISVAGHTVTNGKVEATLVRIIVY